MTILKEQVAAVLARRNEYQEAEAYYEGDVPETFATARLRRAFRTTGDRSRLNFCRSVVDAVGDRLEIAKIAGGTEKANAVINKVWTNNELDLEAQEIHRRALTYGDCYVAVWPDEEGDLQISYNSPKNMTLVYDPENPRKKLYAVKVWLEPRADNDAPRTRMNVYTSDGIHKYVTDSDLITEGSQWRSAGESVENPFGEVPVFHFRTHRPYGRPEHKDGFDAQNAINKLFVTNMFTIDYQGAPQRYALSAIGDSEITDFNEGDTDRENINALRNGPGELWYLKGVTSVGEFKPADASAFWDPIKNTVRAMAALTGTPLHYFEKSGNAPSGNALRTAEGPLLKKVKDRSQSFGQTWREIMRFVLKAEGVNGDVQVFWKEVESLDELERWDVALKKINSGLSHKQALREGGYSEDQITQIEAERREEAKAEEFYKRKPVVRVNESHDETQEVAA
jgi:hypothetical protein